MKKNKMKNQKTTKTTFRVRRYDISPSVFPMLFQTGTSLEVLNEVPVGAAMRGYAIDAQRNCISIFVEHSSFDEVPEGQVFPSADPLQIRKLSGQVSAT